MNAKMLIAAAVLVSFAGATAANATHHRKRHKMVRHAPVTAYVQPGPSVYPGPRPAWAPAGACFTDEGYGRYRPCDASPSGAR
jgi:hypothetical protein